MKIVEVKAARYAQTLDIADLGRGSEIIAVTVRTDDGFTGMGHMPVHIGSAGAIGHVYTTLINTVFANLLVGEDPFAIERLWEKIFRYSTRWGRRGIAVQCLSIIDIALWDMKAKRANVPLWKLLGGPVRDRIPVYANTAHQLPPDALAKKAASYVGMGFKAVKIRGSATAVSTEEATARVKAVREAIGPDVKLLVDVNGTWDVETAITMLRRWEPYRIYWLEEPVHPDDIPGYVQVHRVARQLGVNIAGGEQHATVHDFRQLLQQDAVDIVQPDCAVVGGITEFLRVAHLAQTQSVRISPHTLQHVHNHMVAAVPGTMWVEFFMEDNPLRTLEVRLFPKPREATLARDGMLDLPQAPGLGVEMDPEVAARCRVDDH